MTRSKLLAFLLAYTTGLLLNLGLNSVGAYDTSTAFAILVLLTFAWNVLLMYYVANNNDGPKEA